ncbi:MAG TPA: riboflavin synthase [Desulfotomaculum sp.]|nr:riboflavin synthase [Desulfotomaculum sp.]
MFTGIIEELGLVKGLGRQAVSVRLHVAADKVVESLRVGDSVAVNGVCLTVTGLMDKGFTADVMAETLNRTNLKELKIGDRVNLERALRFGDRLGGHLVAGHIDGVGRILRKIREGIASVFTIQAPPEVSRYLIRKGSVAVDGISLTVVEAGGNEFTVSIIPHTASVTTLGFKQPGDTVNLEADMIGKYVERFYLASRPKGIDRDFLAAHGFI